MAEEAGISVEIVEQAADEKFKPITSQGEFDRRLGAKLNQQRERIFALEQQLADFDAVKEKASKLDELEQANKSELEKAQARIIELEKKAADADTRAQEHLLRAKVIAEAAKKDVVDPDAAFALLDRSTLEIGNDGAPTNIAEAMEQLLEARPYLVAPSGGTTRGSADQGARTAPQRAGQLTRADLQNMTDQEIVQAQKDGRFQDVLSGQT